MREPYSSLVMTLKAPYILALCEAAQRSSVTFGLATRLGAQNSSFNICAAKVIHSIVTFSPATERVALEFLNEFQKVYCLRHLGSVPPLFEYLPFAEQSQLRQCYLVRLKLTLTSGHNTCW